MRLSGSLARRISRGHVICPCSADYLRLSNPILSDMNLVDYLLTQRKVERYYKTFVSRGRVASFLNFVSVNLEITKALFVLSTAVLQL